VAEAERQFNRALRMVASAYGTLGDLEKPLQELNRARESAAQAGDSSVRKVDITELDRLIADLLGEQIEPARRAANALIERVVADEDNFEVIPRT
tara:strand:- start:168 stop:452 length:285 start_codon:yes stop_codon:yes gene_type:complete